MRLMKHNSRVFYLLSMVTVFTVMCTVSCKKERILDNGGELRFSLDTLTFDTVFTSLGSFTAQVKIINPQNQRVNIGSIRLENKSGSTPFIINVNGQASNSVQDVELAANDSLYVFATVNINPNDSTNPFLIEDRLIATLNGKDYSIPFRAYGQNAYYIVDSTLSGNNVWKTDKPYVIINNAAVDENSTLTIPAGCRVYVHGDSRLFVLGTLKVLGTKKDSVVFQSDRLDRKYYGYEGYPGEWGGIYFNITSKDNEINYTIIKNCGNTTTLGDGSFTPAAIQLNRDTVDDNNYQLVMRNTVIENSIGYGILAFSSTLYAENCLINTCGAQCFAAFEGGGYDLNSCTFVNYGITLGENKSKVSHIENPVMAVLNYFDISNTESRVGPLYCVMNNCVVYGSLETEFIAQKRGSNTSADTFSVQLFNCLIKNKDGIPEGVVANNCIVNEDPMFKDYFNWEYNPGDNSPLINSGNNDQVPLPPSPPKFNAVTVDIDDKPRDGQIDIGCYEY